MIYLYGSHGSAGLIYSHNAQRKKLLCMLKEIINPVIFTRSANHAHCRYL